MKKNQLEQLKTCCLIILKRKFRSDVPLAFCLSGGIDSNTLAHIAKKIFNLKLNTFSIIEKILIMMKVKM